MTKINLSEKTACQFHKSNINRCSKLSSKSTVKSMAKNLTINSSSNTKTSQRRIQFRTKFIRLSKSALRTRLCLEILSSQQITIPFTPTQ